MVMGFTGNPSAQLWVLKPCPWGECLSLEFSLLPKLKGPVAWGTVKEVVGA